MANNKITVKITAEVFLEEGETIQDLQERFENSTVTLQFDDMDLPDLELFTPEISEED